ncbi:Tetratricopeptide repeat (TPR)-like superfamily protein [Striga hermonthica]|uniref:Tetratricopeptide repeat (TPR)-like superfamily protein n=1 Tax=Striga hermonthica TaxID=68872 RepID=A0A9N7NFI6_STRHE|nr:Tetratricopeptide repeat (TPR)-like superfamily protein [Striga hermonthica]
MAAAQAQLLHHYHLVSGWPHCRNSFINSYPKSGFRAPIKCSDASPSNRGFGPKSAKAEDKKQKQSPAIPNQAPGLSSSIGGRTRYTSSEDLEFEQRLQAIRKSALEQKKAEEKKQYGAIDYDAPSETNSGTIGLGTKVGVGVAVLAFGLVFALGDFLPYGSVNPTEESPTIKISEKERAVLEKRLVQFEETLGISPEDPTALEGAAVTLAEMGEYKKAAPLLEKLTEKKITDSDAFRLLGEVKYELKDYEGSILAYRSAKKAPESVDFEILRGLTNSLLAAKRPDEAVQELLSSRELLNSGGTVSSTEGIRSVVDPIQGIILKENGNIGDSERMFIQARFFAPDKAKALVDKYSR